MNEALQHLVLDSYVPGRLGPAVNSGRSVFLYGPPGNGKTTIGEAIGRLLSGDVYVPYACMCPMPLTWTGTSSRCMTR